eukprot:TRINITY_DN7638_c0_g1_i1.p1 TRINITY_DN7638_c0_g1~~TRINITY_DN7638_c0_g1_i1.p1  ORF type:complete len:458 (-),score=132.44 TRINITY_DN7638_c0_g1_i1:141-1334(-)
MFVTEREDAKLNNLYINLENIFERDSVLCYQSLDEEEKEIPMLLKWRRKSDESEGKEATVSKEEFTKKWDEFTAEMLNGMDPSNIFAAGGSVLAALTDSIKTKELESSDIDLFIYGVTKEEAKDLVLRILTTVYKNNKKGIIVVRSKQSITISCGYPIRNIQIITRIYKSPGEILLGFDVDSCAVGYDFDNVWVSPRAVRAITKRYNLVNPTRRSTSYEYRLFKYAKRGYAVMIPELDGSKIKEDLYGKFITSTQGLGRLLLYDYNSAPRLENDHILRNAKRGKEQISLPQAYGCQTPSDYSTFLLPYGKVWTFAKLNSLVYSVNKKIQVNGVRDSYILLASLDPSNEEEVPKDFHILKDLNWMTECPMQQGKEELMTGSFHSLSHSDWETDAYSRA